MKFSFVVLHYNQFKEISTQLIPSIEMALDGFAEYDICIVDDSSDEYDKLLTLANDRIKVIQCPVRKNQSMARNLAIANTDGDVILSVDGDDWYSPTGLRAACQWVIDNPNYDLYVSKIARPRARDCNEYITASQPNLQLNIILLGTMQYAVSREYLTRKNLKWDEEKYFWDNEDTYFYGVLLGNTDSISIIETNDNIGIHPLYVGSNSDRSGDVLFQYYPYAFRLLSDMYMNVERELVKDGVKRLYQVYVKRYKKLVKYDVLPRHVRTRMDKNITDNTIPELINIIR